MDNKLNSNELLKYFKLASHEELISYIKENPKDSKVVELKEVLAAFGINLESGGNSHE